MKIDEKYESGEAQNRETVVPGGPTTKEHVLQAKGFVR